MYLTRRLSAFFIFVYLSAGFVLKAHTLPAKPPTTQSVFGYMKLVADWQWNELETVGWKNDKRDWTNGAMYAGMVEWAKVSDDPRYYLKLLQVGLDNRWKTGNIRYFADDYCVGQMYSQLYKVYNDGEFIKDFKQLADSIVVLPHAETLFWQNEIYHREWAWCDALFMGPPALGFLYDATGDIVYLNTASRLWWKTSDYLYDTEEHLFFRDSRYFGLKEKNGKKVFWSRGNGWVLGGLVRMLMVMPENHPDRPRFLKQFKEMAAKVAALQQPDGSWHASLLDPQSYPIKETSGTGFFCYALAWGINQGILGKKQFEPVAVKAWECLVSAVHPKGKLGFVQPQGRDPQHVSSEDTEVYGTGAFLLAGSQMLQLTFPANAAVVKVTGNPGHSGRNTLTRVNWKSITKSKVGPPMVMNAITKQQMPVKIIYDKKKVPQWLEFSSDIDPGVEKYFLIQKKVDNVQD